MADRLGEPIWYELLSPDLDASKRFYEAVVGWRIEAGPSHYRMIQGPGGPAGGLMFLDEPMRTAGAQPAWMIYWSAPDVDATAAKAQSLGAKMFVPPTDVADVGRFSLLMDPQGALFYVMRLDMIQNAPVFSRGAPQRCGWNELVSTDPEAAIRFYADLFGWENRETMNMGPLGGYHYLEGPGGRFGAACGSRGEPSHWNAYFTVPDLGAALSAVRELKGEVGVGPHEVPTREVIALGRDPQGAGFALVQPAPA